MKNSIPYYSVGALLYCPANSDTIINSIVHEKFGNHFSLSLCLEDTIKDDCVKEAEDKLVQTIQTLYESQKSNSDKRFYMMPIFESPTIINLQSRADILYSLKEKLDAVEELVLNIRVGGNDLSHAFGFRRSSSQSIHSIRAISNILSDIVTVFGMDYVISGPVWEYYAGSNWDIGLKNELEEDRLCGFVGKTVIHPNQIELVNHAYKVSRKDLDDARSILDWDTGSNALVSGSVAKERMNEYKTHSNWALKIIMLAEVYGVVE